MIRSASLRALSMSMSDEQFSALMAEKRKRDDMVENAVSVIVKRWKSGEISAEKKDALEAPIYEDYTRWALATGVYEEIEEA